MADESMAQGKTITIDAEYLFDVVRVAYLMGESWRRRNGVDAADPTNLYAKAAYDYADKTIGDLIAAPNGEAA